MVPYTFWQLDLQSSEERLRDNRLLLRSGYVDPATATRKPPTARGSAKSRSDRKSAPVRGRASRKEKAIDVLVAQRAEFHRFLTARVGSDTEAEDLLQQSLLRALKNGDSLRRRERAVAWFFRILRNAVVDHYRQKAAERQRADRLWLEMRAAGETFAKPPKEWDAAVCACFRGLLPTLKPRYAELIRRIDLNGESKATVSRELKIKPGTLDVALHRARYSLRKRLQIFCGACTREKCLECFCAEEKV